MIRLLGGLRPIVDEFRRGMTIGDALEFGDLRFVMIEVLEAGRVGNNMASYSCSWMYGTKRRSLMSAAKAARGIQLAGMGHVCNDCPL